MLFKLRVSDAHSGYRVFTREALERMDLQCEGMEFASEIVVKAAGAKLSVTEVPINYHARIGESKLNSIGDAWRHIRFLLLSSPAYLFLVPGAVLIAVGLIGSLALFGVTGGMSLIVSKALLALAVLSGLQVVVLGSAATTGTNRHLLGRTNRVSTWVSSGAAAEKGFVAGSILVAFGFGFLIYSCFAGMGCLRFGRARCVGPHHLHPAPRSRCHLVVRRLLPESLPGKATRRCPRPGERSGRDERDSPAGGFGPGGAVIRALRSELARNSNTDGVMTGPTPDESDLGAPCPLASLVDRGADL